MTIIESKRLRKHVVFHCPSCETDRVGERSSGAWSPWPSERSMNGPHIECAACAAQTSA